MNSFLWLAISKRYWDLSPVKINQTFLLNFWSELKNFNQSTTQTPGNSIKEIKLTRLEYFSYIGGGKRGTWRKTPTCSKSLTNFVT